MRTTTLGKARPFSLLVAIAIAFVPTRSLQAEARDPGVRGGPTGAGGPLPGLSAADLAFFKGSADDFSEDEPVPVGGDSNGGLGPRFNGVSCSSCHSQPAVGGSSPPVRHCTSCARTPYSSCRIPRIHTGAVIWYSGTPILLPASSFGSRMPLFVETKMHE